jgi:hypothetical protein
MIRSLVDADADVNAQNRRGCAVCARGESADECAAPSRRRRRPCRETPLHWAAINGRSSSVAELLLRGADGAVQNNYGYRCAAPHSRNRRPQQPRARRRTPKRSAARCLTLAAYEAGESEVHSARRLTAPAIAPVSRPIPPRAACAVGVCRRRSPIQRGGRQQPTQHSHCNERPRRAPRRALLHPRVEV